MFLEVGNYRMQKDSKLIINQFTWANEAHIVFVDQPFGTGFSYVNDEGDIKSVVDVIIIVMLFSLI